MEYPNIVALIDARIAHLRQTRKLLLATPEKAAAPPRKQTRPRPSIAPVPRPIRTEPSPAVVPQTIAVETPVPAPVRLRPSFPRTRSSAKKAPITAEAHSALGGHLPTGPVVVSAARVREEEAHRRGADEEALPVQEAPADPSQILQRWRQAQNAGGA
jgi:hypothetical protein